MSFGCRKARRTVNVSVFGHGIAVNGAGDVCITGDTWSADFPTTAGAYKTALSGRYSDVFVAKLNLGGAR